VLLRENTTKILIYCEVPAKLEHARFALYIFCEPLNVRHPCPFCADRVYVGCDDTALSVLPVPDLSNHVDTEAPFAGTVPVPEGSVPSNHIEQPPIDVGVIPGYGMLVMGISLRCAHYKTGRKDPWTDLAKNQSICSYHMLLPGYNRGMEI
jgi:hypothetical protein